MKFCWYFVPVLLLVLLWGCMTNSGAFVSVSEFSAATVCAPQERVLAVGDELELSVLLDGLVEVAPVHVEVDYSGNVPVPLIGAVPLAGLTVVEAVHVLEGRYGLIYRGSPSVLLKSPQRVEGDWGYVTLLGQVGHAGRVPVSSASGMRLSDALQAAGGFGSSANLNNIVVTRVLSTGESIKCRVDFKNLGTAGAGETDILLFSGDRVYVHERLF